MVFHAKTPTLDEIEMESLGDRSVRGSSSTCVRRPVRTERFVLSIDGLSCACCPSGLVKAIKQIPAIHDYHLNLALARLEIDLDIDHGSIDEVILQLHAPTGYTFEAYTCTEGQVLELLVDDVAEVRRWIQPKGVLILDTDEKQSWTPCRIFSGRSSVMSADRMRRTGSPSVFDASCGTVRIHYDSKIIGARWLFKSLVGIFPNTRLAPPSPHPSLAMGARRTKRAFLVFLVTLAFTIPILVFAWAPLHHEKKMVYEHPSLVLASVVQAIGLREFAPPAFRSLVHKTLGMDLLITLSTSVAYVFSVVSYVFEALNRPLETGCFFETSTLLVTLILLGRVINEAARYRAAKAVSIRSLQTDSALIIHSGSPSEITENVDSRLLQYGDRFKVLPHTRVPTDGIVEYGGSEVDESMITGESTPVAKGQGSRVYAGTVNGRGTLIVALTALPHENSISKIATMVEDAELTKPKAQALADQIASWFVPAIATIGALVFLIWLFVDHYHNKRSWGRAVVRAMTYGIASLIVSCPCAIGLAVPMVILIACGVAARFGVIFRDPKKLEVARKVTDIVFDKTGTITTGNLTVVQVKTYGGSTTTLVQTLLGLLDGISHPVSIAVLDWAKKKAADHEGSPLRPTEFLSVDDNIAYGVSGLTKGDCIPVRAGKPKWLGVHALDSDFTVLCVTINNEHVATFRLKDRIRNTARPVIENLHNQGIVVHMLSGDNQGAVNAVAFTLGIAPPNVAGDRHPADKQRYIQDLQDTGKIVMFVGDGTNDAIALKQADVGVHLQHARSCDVAKCAADIIVMNPHSLQDLLTMIDISRAAYRRVVLNFVWSAAYNVVAVLMAAGAFVKIRIAPEWAGLGELVSVLPVVLIAFQMKGRAYGKAYRGKGWTALEEPVY